MAAKKKSKSKKTGDPHPGRPTKPLSRLLRLPKGPVDLARIDTAASPGYPGSGKADAPALTPPGERRLAPALAKADGRPASRRAT